MMIIIEKANLEWVRTMTLLLNDDQNVWTLSS